MRKNTVLVLIVLLALAAGCMGSLENYKKEACVDLPNDKVITAIKENCLSCHSDDFNTKEDICSRKTMIIDSVSKGRMPKMGTLYDHYKETIVNWK